MFEKRRPQAHLLYLGQQLGLRIELDAEGGVLHLYGQDAGQVSRRRRRLPFSVSSVS